MWEMQGGEWQKEDDICGSWRQDKQISWWAILLLKVANPKVGNIEIHHNLLWESSQSWWMLSQFVCECYSIGL